MSQQPITIKITQEGALVYVYQDDHPLASLAQDGRATTARASHVEPTPDGRWQADMAPVGGPLLPPTSARAESLALELTWIRENLLSPGPDQGPAVPAETLLETVGA